MLTNEQYKGGENFDLRQMLLTGKNLRLGERTGYFSSMVTAVAARGEQLHMRCILSGADRSVIVEDPTTGQKRSMLMFGSNNYLGLAGHPSVKESAAQALREYGAGVGGPPLLNGYTTLHRELEERLAALKGCESAMLFSSGYGANVGLVTALVNQRDRVLYDAYSHASFCDGIKMADVQSRHFPHNDIDRMEKMLEACSGADHDVFVGVEGVYSMDGDLAPLDRLTRICRERGAILLLDDAHGTGVMGRTGRGSAEHFGVEGLVDITMGTFSKTFATTGGFIASTGPIIEYLRYFARSYVFSASLPPVVAATVIAGLDVIEREPELIARLHDNVAYAAAGLNRLGFDLSPEGAIIPLAVPPGMNIRKAARRFHEKGIFVNSVEFPAVPLSQQRFRVSLMATHTRDDIDRLIDAVGEVWLESAKEFSLEEQRSETEIAWHEH